MPIAFQNFFKTFTGGIKKLEPLGEAMERAVTVLARQRGAFLVGWFGTAVPTQGLAVRAYVVNSDAVFHRIDHARRLQSDHRRQELMPNLIEPLMGMGGVLLGGLFGNALGAGAAVGAHSSGPFGLIPGVAAGIVLAVGMGLGALAGVAAVIYGLVKAYGLYSYLTGDDDDEGGYTTGFYSDLAAMGRDYATKVAAATGIANDLVAERESVRDPVLRAVLTLGDRIAAALTQLVGTAASFLTLKPYLEALRPAVEPLRRFAEAMLAYGKAIVMSVYEDLAPARLIGRFVTVLMAGLPDLDDMTARIEEFTTAAIDAIAMPITHLKTGAEAMFESASESISAAVTDHPVSKLIGGLGSIADPLRNLGNKIRALLSQMVRNITPDPIGLVRDAIEFWFDGDGDGDEAAEPPSPPLISADLLARLVPSGGGSPTVPTPVTPTVAPVVAAAALAEIESQPIHIVGSVARTFQRQIPAIRRQGREALADPMLGAATALIDNAARLVGLDAHVEQAWGYLADFEEPLGPLPVQDPAPPRRIVPVIGRLRVSAPGRSRELVEDWTSSLTELLVQEPVPLPAGGG